MSRDARFATAIVITRDAMRAARVEAALRGLAGWRVVVGTPSRLSDLLQAHPDAIVVTVLDDGDTRRLLRAMRAPATMALASDPRSLWTAPLRALGLRAVLPLAATTEEVLAAARAVHAGLLVAHPETLEPTVARGAVATAGAPLTAREREILEMLADGVNNRTIASRLAISRHTVKFHVAAILAKLGARSRTEAVAVALRSGLFEV